MHQFTDAYMRPRSVLNCYVLIGGGSLTFFSMFYYYLHMNELLITRKHQASCLVSVGMAPLHDRL